MKRLTLLALVLLLGVEIFADHGEYKSPVAPPFGGSKQPKGLTRTPTWRRRLPTETTPPVEGRKPGEVTPGAKEEETSGRQLTRRDDRFRWDIWWELDHRLFLGERPVLSGAAREAALKALVSSLKDEDPVVRSHAQGALARVGSPQAVVACLATLEENASGGHGAILALGILGGESVIAPLKKVVMSEKRDLYARTLALAALGFTRSPDATSFLREVVDEEPRPNLRSAAIVALGLHRDAESVGRLRALLVARARGSGLGDLDPLDDIVRCAAASALGHIGTDAGRAALLNAIEEGDGLASGSAALALGCLFDPAAKAALRETVLSARPLPARALSIVALARRGDPGLRPALLKLLDDPPMLSTNLAGVAIAALGIVGEEEDAKRLAEILASADIPASNRAAAAAALGRLGARGGIAPLKANLGRAKDPLLRGHVVLAMARLGAPGTDEAIKENLEKGKMPSLKRLTVDALARRGGKEGLKHLIAALRDEYYVNREAAREIIRVDANLALTAILARHADEQNANARIFAVDALGWLLTENAPAIDVARNLNLLSRMPLIQSLLSLGREDYLYDLALDL